MEVSMQVYDSLDVPYSPGVYLLHLELPRPRSLRIGKLGEFNLPAGQCLYVGSALGPGGLRARLGRHLRGSENRHWHIDWLRRVSEVKGCFYSATNNHLECSWNQFLLDLPGACIPVSGFGASDCRNKPTPCTAHLVWFGSGADINLISDNLPVDGRSQVVYQKFTTYIQPDYDDIE
jgi:Uri superfamily endonuclease